MTVRHMRLTLGLFFLVVGGGLLVARVAAPDRVARAFDLTRLTIGAFLALVLSGVNLAKWYAGRVAYEQLTTPVRRPLQPNPAPHGGAEPNPEFDFTRPAPGPAEGPPHN